jgi:hypothetical protein
MAVTIPPWRPPVTPGATLNGQRGLKEQLETVAAASTAIPIVYGECMIGGRIFAATYTGGVWYVGAMFCVGEIDSYVNLYLNDAAPVTGVTVTYYRGTTSQTADATLAAAISGYTDTLIVSTPQGSVGVAYVVITYTDALYSGLPSIKARIKGRKVYNTSGNLIANSEDITGAGWALVNVDTGRTANAATAPDGTVTADKLTEATTTSNSHQINAPIVSAVEDYQPLTFSAFVKAAERTFVRLVIITKANVFVSVTVDLSAVSVTSIAGAALILGYGITDAGDGWRRVWISADAGTGGTAVRGRIVLLSNSTTSTYAGTIGSGLYVWGSQFETKRTPGVYTSTGATASAAAFSENPALCLRDLIGTTSFGLGEDTDDLSFQSTATECSTVVIAEQRRRVALVIDDARTADDWISTLAGYAGAWSFKRGGSWVAIADRPAKLYQFTASANGWTATNATAATTATAWQLTQTAADVYAVSPSSLNICGVSARYVRVRLQRTAGSGSFTIELFYTTALHAVSNSFVKQATWTAANSTYVVIEFDMHALTAGGADWKTSIINSLRLDLTASAGTDVWLIDWISVGILPITTASIVSGSFSASVADAIQSPTVVKCKYTDTSTTPWREREAEAVLAGVSTGTVPRRESQISMPGVRFYSQAYREAAERLLKLQRTTQVEFVTFDEGLQISQGDVLSIMHPYIDTAAAVECDAATLFRVVAQPAVVSPGRVRITATAYSDADYDNTEPTVTWKAAPTLLGALDVGRSGDGINRIHGRFAGAFANPDYNGQFPVTKGATVTIASVSVGTGTAPDPTAGYYGAYALKISTDTSGTDRAVYFGSSATDFNIAIEPNSQWLFSGKFWPSTGSNVSVSFAIKTATATYTLTDTTNTLSTWNDFVHTATGSNLLDLSADTNNLALMRMDVNASSAKVFFDGLMLEKKISNGAVTSGWRPPVASATNPARLNPQLVAPGLLDDNVSIDDGNGNAKAIVAGVLTGTVADGASITFSPAFLRVPTVQFNPTALTYNSAYSASSHALVCEARSLTVSGFTAYLKVRQLAATITARTDTTPTDGGALAVPRYTIQKAASALEAWDGRYTFNFDVVVKNSLYFNSVWGSAATYQPGSVTVGVYIATSDSGAALYTPTWTLAGSITVGGTGGTSPTTSRSGQTVTVTRDGLTQRGGSCPEFGIAITSELVSGGTLTFTNVNYSTAAALTETSATPAGFSTVPYTVIP